MTSNQIKGFFVFLKQVFGVQDQEKEERMAERKKVMNKEREYVVKAVEDVIVLHAWRENKATLIKK